MGDDETTVNSQHLPSPITDDVPSKQLPLYKPLLYKPLLENPSNPITPLNFNMEHCYDILGSCNGLLCLFDIYQHNFASWNPSINLKSKTSPTIITSDNEIIIDYGFGYDQINDKYKVLVIVLHKFEKTAARIYTFGEFFWNTFPNFLCYLHSQLGVYLSGTLNWIGNKDNEDVLISIDLEKEIYGEVSLPQHDDADNVRSTHLSILSDCLCVSFDYETHWTVWTMKEYGVAESWTKLMIIPQQEFK